MNEKYFFFHFRIKNIIFVVFNITVTISRRHAKFLAGCLIRLYGVDLHLHQDLHRAG